MILWLYRLLIGGCRHKWAIIQSGNYEARNDLGSYRVGKYYDLQCEHCGKIKTKRV